MKYYSVSRYPGTVGKYFFSYFFNKYNINATYNPIGCEPQHFNSVIDDLLNDTQTAGISISMPYKRTIIEYMTTKQCTHDDSVMKYGICNTVIAPNLTTYNCDLAGVIEVVKDIPYDSNISVLGDGAIGKMFSDYLLWRKYKNVIVYSRALGNWEHRHNPTDVVINCTSIGTVTNDSSLEYIPGNTTKIIDLSVIPGMLNTQAVDKQCEYVSGLSFYYYQFIEQFYCYTGIRLEYDSVMEAGKLR